MILRSTLLRSNPLVRRLQRYSTMATLYRSAESGSSTPATPPAVTGRYRGIGGDTGAMVKASLLPPDSSLPIGMMLDAPVDWPGATSQLMRMVAPPSSVPVPDSGLAEALARVQRAPSPAPSQPLSERSQPIARSTQPVAITPRPAATVQAAAQAPPQAGPTAAGQSPPAESPPPAAPTRPVAITPRPAATVQAAAQAPPQAGPTAAGQSPPAESPPAESSPANQKQEDSWISEEEWSRLKAFMEGHQAHLAQQKQEAGEVQLSPEEQAKIDAKERAKVEIARRQEMVRSGKIPRASVQYVSPGESVMAPQMTPAEMPASPEAPADRPSPVIQQSPEPAETVRRALSSGEDEPITPPVKVEQPPESETKLPVRKAEAETLPQKPDMTPAMPVVPPAPKQVQRASDRQPDQHIGRTGAETTVSTAEEAAAARQAPEMPVKVDEETIVPAGHEIEATQMLQRTPAGEDVSPEQPGPVAEIQPGPDYPTIPKIQPPPPVQREGKIDEAASPAAAEGKTKGMVSAPPAGEPEIQRSPERQPVVHPSPDMPVESTVVRSPATSMPPVQREPVVGFPPIPVAGEKAPGRSIPATSASVDRLEEQEVEGELPAARPGDLTQPVEQPSIPGDMSLPLGQPPGPVAQRQPDESQPSTDATGRSIDTPPVKPPLSLGRRILQAARSLFRSTEKAEGPPSTEPTPSFSPGQTTVAEPGREPSASEERAEVEAPVRPLEVGVKTIPAAESGALQRDDNSIPTPPGQAEPHLVKATLEPPRPVVMPRPVEIGPPGGDVEPSIQADRRAEAPSLAEQTGQPVTSPIMRAPEPSTKQAGVRPPGVSQELPGQEAGPVSPLPTPTGLGAVSPADMGDEDVTIIADVRSGELPTSASISPELPATSPPAIQRDSDAAGGATPSQAVRPVPSGPVRDLAGPTQDRLTGDIKPPPESEVAGDIAARETFEPSPQRPARPQIQPMPLDEAWPVERTQPLPAVQPAPEGDSPARIQKRESGTFVQRKLESEESTSAEVHEALKQVMPAQETDSAVELLTPRRPRPKVPVKPRSSPEISREVEPSPAKPSEPALPLREQRGELSSLGDESASPRAFRPPPDEVRMVPTGIGDLPSDLWQLMGETPPSPRPALVTTTPGAGAEVTGTVQRDVAVAPRPAVPDRPPLQVALAEGLIDLPLVQRENGRPAEAPAGAAEEAAKEGGGAEVNVKELAKQVYPEIRRRLALEWERSRGRF